MQIHEKIWDSMIDKTLFLTAFPLMQIGYFVIPYLYFIVVVTFGLLLSGFLSVYSINFHKSRLSYSSYPKFWSQVEQMRYDSEKIAYLTSHDLLTGLYNRGWLDRFLSDPAFPENNKRRIRAS